MQDPTMRLCKMQSTSSVLALLACLSGALGQLPPVSQACSNALASAYGAVQEQLAPGGAMAMAVASVGAAGATKAATSDPICRAALAKKASCDVDLAPEWATPQYSAVVANFKSTIAQANPVVSVCWLNAANINVKADTYDQTFTYQMWYPGLMAPTCTAADRAIYLTWIGDQFGQSGVYKAAPVFSYEDATCGSSTTPTAVSLSSVPPVCAGTAGTSCCGPDDDGLGPCTKTGSSPASCTTSSDLSDSECQAWQDFTTAINKNAGANAFCANATDPCGCPDFASVFCDDGHLTGIYMGNEQLRGATIPGSFGDLTQLTGLQVQSSQFTGTVPPSFSQLTKLSYLIMTGNSFSGLAPALDYKTQFKQAGGLAVWCGIGGEGNRWTCPLPAGAATCNTQGGSGGHGGASGQVSCTAAPASSDVEMASPSDGAADAWRSPGAVAGYACGAALLATAAAVAAVTRRRRLLSRANDGKSRHASGTPCASSVGPSPGGTNPGVAAHVGDDMNAL